MPAPSAGWRPRGHPRAARQSWKRRPPARMPARTPARPGARACRPVAQSRMRLPWTRFVLLPASPRSGKFRATRRARRAQEPGPCARLLRLSIVLLAGRAARDDIHPLEPAAEIDVAAARRTERMVRVVDRLSADGARAAGPRSPRGRVRRAVKGLHARSPRSGRAASRPRRARSPR